jgi:hypothetical protein
MAHFQRLQHTCCAPRHDHLGGKTITFGVTVLPEWAQAEGITPLLDRLQAANVTDIATSPYDMEPSDEGTREPPADAGSGKARLLDRELWGRRPVSMPINPSTPTHLISRPHQAV